MKDRIDLRSLLVGIFLGAVVTVAVAAATDHPVVKEIFPVRFRVIEVSTPEVEWPHMGQVALLRLAPWYGKISKEAHDWRAKHETQEFTVVTFVDRGYEIRKDEIIGLQAYQHLKSDR